ncbi:GTP cyclohydrolase I [Streptosporangium oxazolinicum]
MDITRVEQLYRELLVAFGEDPDREGLRDTPRRAAGFWRDFLGYDAGRTDTAFAQEITGDHLVLVSGIRSWSMCEHHLLPIDLGVTIGYVPASSVLGLSKLVRITEMAARRLQVQERIVERIAAEVMKVTGSADVAVTGVGHHLCMSMRGVRSAGARTVTQSWHGRFPHDPHLAARMLSGTSEGKS